MRLAAPYDTAPRASGVAVVIVLHVLVLAALLRIEAVRNAVAEAAPLFVSFITPEQPKVELPPPPALPKIVPKKEPPRLITTEAARQVTDRIHHTGHRQSSPWWSCLK